MGFEWPDGLQARMAAVDWEQECPNELWVPKPERLDLAAVTGLKFGDYWEAWDVSIRDLVDAPDEDDNPIARVFGCDEQNGWLFQAYLPRGCSGPHVLVWHAGEVVWVPTDELDLKFKQVDQVSGLLDDVESAIAPAMHVFWPITRDVEEETLEEWSFLIRSLPLVVVEIGTVAGFGMTGGGMDMTYSIAEAYVRCGWQPPRELRDVPWEPESPDNRWTAVAMWKSQRAAWMNAASAVERLEEKVGEWLTEETRAVLLP